MTESLGLSDVQSFVRGRYGDHAGHLESLGSGDWSMAYAFTLDSNEVVIRFGAYGEDFAKDQVMHVLSSPALPIPKVLEVGETSTGFFAVSERAYGDFLDELNETGMRAAVPSVLRALDVVKEIDVSGTTGYGIWSSDGKGRHSTWQDALLEVGTDQNGGRIQGWRRALESSPIGAEAFDTAFGLLRELVPNLPSDRHLIHGDLLYHNVLVDHDHITAVLDWGNSMYGDYLYDAAWLIYCRAQYTRWSAVDIRREFEKHWVARGTTPGNLEERLRAYQIHIGLGAQAYSAHMGRLDDLAINAEQTMKLAKAATGDS
jgi:hygromycin-B 4-O-kinase